MRVIHRDAVGWSIAWSVALIIIGILALLLPLVAGVAISITVAWLLLLGGFVHLAFAYHARGAGGVAWQVVVGLLYLIGGIYLLLHPVVGLVGLTLILAGYLLVKGIMEFVLASQLHGAPGGGWLVVDGIVSVILAVLLWKWLPGSAVWALGTLVGIAILFSGFSRLALALSSRRAHGVLVT